MKSLVQWAGWIGEDVEAGPRTFSNFCWKGRAQYLCYTKKKIKLKFSLPSDWWGILKKNTVYPSEVYNVCQVYCREYHNHNGNRGLAGPWWSVVVTNCLNESNTNNIEFFYTNYVFIQFWMIIKSWCTVWTRLTL